jgi:hypothetical protein
MPDDPANPAPTFDPNEDKILGDWVYCRQHRRPHTTGWCTVGLWDKLGLGILGPNTDENREAAARKCRDFGLPMAGS